MGEKYNNIFDEVCCKIYEFKEENNLKANTLYMGVDKYNELYKFCKRNKVSDCVYENDRQGKVIALTEIKNCVIKISMSGVLYATYEEDYLTKLERKNKEKLIDKLFFSYMEQREIVNSMDSKKLKQIDEDVNDLHKFLEFEYYYDRWVEGNEGGDK